MRHVRIGEATLHYEAEALERPRCVVFINSLGSDLRIWDDVAERTVAAGFGALRFDLRGHGLSDLGEPPRVIADHASDVAELMDAVGLKRASLCGVSVGGAIAIAFAARYPERVERLALCCTGARIGTTESWNARITEAQRAGVGAIVESVLQRWHPAAAYRENGGLVAMTRNMLARTPVDGYVATCIALRDSDLTAEARALTAPTLCIAGAEDGSTPPAMVRALSESVPGAKYLEIADAGHLPGLQQPDIFASALLDFLE